MSRQMGDGHRLFLQNMMTNGIVSAAQAGMLHKKCCELHGGQEKIDDFINVVNTHLQPLFMHIRKGMSEEDGQEHFVLMDLIVESDSGSASSTAILNSADKLISKKLKKKEAELVLNKFVQDKWLKEQDGEYTLSVRCIVEMEPYMRTIYQDMIKVCYVCHNIALQCQVCENPSCEIKVHLPCVARYFRARSDPHCPACNDFWPHEIPAPKTVEEFSYSGIRCVR
ncbi:non-structural maintenance of chromosomes element 1 homolog isoform X3 [Danio rerio]|uniref:Non-structural maintenance of chromosomes element 1 homolog isoform X3 n=1 Tax=Danio rerio TaxID=7955 RepID=A0AC58ILH2_DANRE